MRKVLFVCGGWEGHTPRECVDLFAPWLEAQDFAVEVAETLEVFADAARLKGYDLIVPAWTLGELSDVQEKHLCDAVAGGVGLAGWHGGVGDAFRTATNYQFMVGGQFVAHPGDMLAAWDVRIVDREHPITHGLDGFTMHDTERYYLHVDPSNHVLAVTPMEGGFDMPVAWTRTWGRGRVAYCSIGHTDRDFDNPQARELVQRCLLWAARAL
jgi:type 1 glutamine amidotransferase